MDYSSAFRINRNIVECKDKYGAITAEAESSININIVECKGLYENETIKFEELY